MKGTIKNNYNLKVYSNLELNQNNTINNESLWYKCSNYCTNNPKCICWSYQSNKNISGPSCYLKYAFVGSELSFDSNTYSDCYLNRIEKNCDDKLFKPWRYSFKANKIRLNSITYSNKFQDILLSTNCVVSYTHSDTWYCSWASDNNLKCLYEDGRVNRNKVSGHPKDPTITASGGVVTVVGDNPLTLQLINASSIDYHYKPWDGRFTSGNVYINNTWYVSSALRKHSNEYISNCGGHCIMGPTVSFSVLTNTNINWEIYKYYFRDESDNLYHQESNYNLTKHVKYGEIHVVDFGRNHINNPYTDNYTYFISHGSDPSLSNKTWLLWNQGDAIYITRIHISINSINNPNQWEFWNGNEWIVGSTNGIIEAKPILTYINHTGSASMTYIPDIQRFLLVYTTSHITNYPLNGTDLYIYESNSITGPFELIDCLHHFAINSYFPTISSKFMSYDNITNDLTIWLSFSTLREPIDKDNDIIAGYSWNLIKMKLKYLSSNTTNRVIDFHDLTNNQSLYISISILFICIFIFFLNFCYFIFYMRNNKKYSRY